MEPVPNLLLTTQDLQPVNVLMFHAFRVDGVSQTCSIVVTGVVRSLIYFPLMNSIMEINKQLLV